MPDQPSNQLPPWLLRMLVLDAVLLASGVALYLYTRDVLQLIPLAVASGVVGLATVLMEARKRRD